MMEKKGQLSLDESQESHHSVVERDKVRKKSSTCKEQEEVEDKQETRNSAQRPT